MAEAKKTTDGYAINRAEWIAEFGARVSIQRFTNALGEARVLLGTEYEFADEWRDGTASLTGAEAIKVGEALVRMGREAASAEADDRASMEASRDRR